jgi:hypothetical protein
LGTAIATGRGGGRYDTSVAAEDDKALNGLLIRSEIITYTVLAVWR